MFQKYLNHNFFVIIDDLEKYAEAEHNEEKFHSLNQMLNTLQSNTSTSPSLRLAKLAVESMMQVVRAFLIDLFLNDPLA